MNDPLRKLVQELRDAEVMGRFRADSSMINDFNDTRTVADRLEAAIAESEKGKAELTNWRDWC